MQAGDLTSEQAPTQALVEKVSDQLVEGNPKLGFVVLTNTLNLLGNAKNVRRFQAKLYEQVMRHIVTQAKAPRWLHWLSQQVANHLVQPSENPEDPLMNPEFISINGLSSPKYLHRDHAGKSLLVSLSYGVNQGCKGGLLSWQILTNMQRIQA